MLVTVPRQRPLGVLQAYSDLQRRVWFQTSRLQQAIAALVKR
jgi:hypothetical protein